MSFSLKREIEFYVNDVDSTDGVQKLAILPEFELSVQSNLLQVFRKIIGEDPEMLPRGVVDQISPVTLGFMTYLKPASLDGLAGITAPEKILYDSLGGVLGYRSADYYKVQFGRVNRLIPLYIYIKTTTAIYKINTCYVDSLELSFDINYILIGKWTAQAISLEVFNTNDVVFTNVKDYSNIDVYLRAKFTSVNITDYDDDSKVYKFPITKSNIKIQNTLMPVYDKNIKVVTGTVKDLIVGGRAVSGELSCYLSSRILHSREFLKSISEDLTKVNRKYKVEYELVDGTNAVSIILPHAVINVPNLSFEDVLNVNIQFTSSESDYGLNDDLDLKYYSYNNEFTYDEYIYYGLNPEYYYKFDDLVNTTIKNYGSKGPTFDLTRSGSVPTMNLAGPYLNSKTWNLYSSYCQNSVVKDPVDNLYISYWWKSDTINANEWLFRFQSDISDRNVRIQIERGASLSGGGYRGLYYYIGNSGYTIDVANVTTWNHIVVFIKHSIRKVLIYTNNVLKVNATYSEASITGDFLCCGVSGGNDTNNTKFSEVIISQNIREEDVAGVTSVLYNITDKNKTIKNVNVKYSSYSDNLLTYKGFSDYYYKVIKSYNSKAFWRFNDNDSTTVRDHITGAYPLTISNNPELGIDGPLLNDDKSKSIWFNRTGSGILQYTTSSKPISTTGINQNTYTFWVYIDDDNLPNINYKQCLIKTGSNNGTVFTLLRRAGDDGKVFIDGKWHYNYSMGYSDGYYDCTYSFANYFPIPIQTWTFIVLTCNRSTNNIKAYVNGILKSDITNGNVNSSWPSTIALEVGKRTYVDSYRSTFKLSEFAYFEKILSDTTIQGIYAASGITGFSYTITPSSTGNSLNISGNVPTITRGLITYPSHKEVNISGNIPNIKIIFVVHSVNGSLYQILHHFVVSKIPKISKSKYVLPITASQNISGNTLNIYKLRFVRPLKSRIEINKNIINVLKIYNPIKKSLGLQENIPYSVHGNIKLVYVVDSTIEISGNTVSIARNIKPVKPLVGHVSIGNPLVSYYYKEVLTYSPALYYQFNETSGTTLIDYSSNSRHATLYNSPTLNQTGPHGTGSTSIYFSRASLQHGIYNTAISMPSQGTIAVWVKVVSPTSFDHIFQFNYSYNSGNNSNYFKLTKEATWWVMPFLSGWSSSWQITLTDGAWSHVAITWNTSTNQISTYVNGSVVTNNGSHTNWPTSLQPLGIGRGNRDGVSHYYNGYQSNFTLIPQRLNSTQILDLYNKSTAIQAPFDNKPIIYQWTRLPPEPMAIIFI